MLTLSFIYNFAPKKIKPKTMDTKPKAFTGILPCSSPSRIQFSSKEAPPTESLVCNNLVLKYCTRRKLMSESALPNEVTRCVGNPKPNL